MGKKDLEDMDEDEYMEEMDSGEAGTEPADD